MCLKRQESRKVSHLKTIKNSNLVEVSVRFPYVYPLLCKLRISNPANLALDVEELAHIPGSENKQKQRDHQLRFQLT